MTTKPSSAPRHAHVVEAEAPAAPPRQKLELRRQKTRDGADALLGLAARAPAAAPLAEYDANDDACTVVTTESGRKPRRQGRKRASGRAKRAPAVPTEIVPPAAIPTVATPAAVSWSPDASGLSIFAGLTGSSAPLRARPPPPPFRAGQPRVALRLDRAAFAGVVDQGATLQCFPGEVLSHTRSNAPLAQSNDEPCGRALFVGDAAPFFQSGAARPAALSALQRIARDTDCVVVLSSTAPCENVAALGAALGAARLRACTPVSFTGSGLASDAERQVLEVLQWLAGRSDARTLRWACLDATGSLRKAYAAVARAARAAPSLAARFVRVPAFDAGTLHAVTTRLAAGLEPRAPPRAPKRAVAFAVPVKAPPSLGGRFAQFAFREAPTPATAPRSPQSPAFKRLRRESASPVLVASV